jgi:hypothetical protein
MGISIGDGEILYPHRINADHDQNQLVKFHHEAAFSDSEASSSVVVPVDSEAICAHSGTVAL